MLDREQRYRCDFKLPRLLNKSSMVSGDSLENPAIQTVINAVEHCFRNCSNQYSRMFCLHMSEDTSLESLAFAVLAITMHALSDDLQLQLQVSMAQHPGGRSMIASC